MKCVNEKIRNGHQVDMQLVNLKDRSFILALIVITLLFGLLLWPFYAAIFWATALAVLFWPLYERILSSMPRSPALASLLTIVACVLLVVVPLALVAISAAQEVVQLYDHLLADGGSGIEARIHQAVKTAPPWLRAWLERMGLNQLDGIRGNTVQILEQALQFIASHAVAVGQDTLRLAVSFTLMLYLLFFAFRDGTKVVENLRDALPIERSYLGELGLRFENMVKATIKGSLMVAGIQGALGGVLFWLLGIQGAVLWGVVMAVLSLIPVLGAWLVWGPVALYLLATGEVAKAALMAAFGAGVIGLIDNILRPILVGKEARMPDYIVLLSTLGGISLFGLTGLVAGPVIAAFFMAAWSLFVAGNTSDESSTPHASVEPGNSG